jgi:hypothetical protein
MTNRPSREEAVAKKVFDLLADIRLSPYYIGYYLAHPPHPGIYDMLKGVVEAMERTEEERRQEIKEMIVGDKTITSFENMCAILYDFQERYGFDTRENIVNFLRVQNLGIPLAIAYQEKWVSNIKPEGRVWIEKCFADFLEMFGLEDIGWTDLFVIETTIGLEPE